MPPSWLALRSITSSLTALKKVCADVLADQPDENTKECVGRMVGVIEEMEGSVGQGVREIVRISSASPTRNDPGPSLNLENPAADNMNAGAVQNNGCTDFCRLYMPW